MTNVNRYLVWNKNKFWWLSLDTNDFYL